MPYRRTRKAYVRRRRPLRRRPSRPSYSKTARRYRSRTYRTVRRRKGLLNVTSKKKRDDMLSISDVTLGERRSGVYVNGPAELVRPPPGTNPPAYFLWCATARNTQPNTGLSAGEKVSPTDVATRSAMTCYMRGLSERIRIETNDGSAWTWRRVVFRMKGLRFLNEATASIPERELFRRNLLSEDSGYGRLVTDSFDTALGQVIEAFVFKGTELQDWSSPMLAKIDTTRVSVMYDKTINIRSGNASGITKVYKRWHPINRNLVYNDDEFGAESVDSHFSTEGLAGCGDVYVLDIILPNALATEGSRLSFEPEATLYWHER